VSWLDMNVGCYGGTRCSAGGNLDEFGGDSAVGHYGLYEVSDGTMTLALRGTKGLRHQHTLVSRMAMQVNVTADILIFKKRYYFLYTF